MSFPSSHDYELTLFFYPSPKPGVGWSSPAHLALTTAALKLLKIPRPIGHVSVRVSSKKDPELNFHAGMTQENKDEGRAEVLRRGYGLGILFHDFKGRLETARELDPEVLGRAQAGNLSYLRFEINRPIASRLARYLEEFVEKGGDSHYGAPHRPLFGEGGGCAAFAASFLELAGLGHDEFAKVWTRTHRLPSACIGGPKGGKSVSMLKVLTRLSWASEREAFEPYFTWDPDLMHQWVLESVAKERARLRDGYRPESWNKAYGLVVDARDRACPDGPIFQGVPDFTRMTREFK